jgi:hypothetical protein
MGALFGAGPEIAYGQRTLILKRAGIALWDVMASCVRPGSLDADIDERRSSQRLSRLLRGAPEPETCVL